VDLPVREGSVIPYVVAAPYDVGTHNWQFNPPDNHLIVMVKGSYDIVPDGAARPRETPNFITGERFYQDDAEASAIYPDDMAIFKGKADVVMAGHAYPPEAGAVATRVSFAFGSEGNRFERSINAYGDRVWQRGLVTAAGDPHPFEKIPLVYERAYGGPKLASNPVGRGYKDSELMPNLEELGKLVTTPDGKYAPACFAPLAMGWSARWSQLGTYDRSWFKTRWPYFPADFDWTFFQAAPLEQRLGYLRGDEPFEAKGVRPEMPVVRGNLAGEHARAFLLKRGDENRLHEVMLHLDTVAFDFDAMTVDVVWRGQCEVSGKDAADVQAIFAVRQPLDGEKQTDDQIWELFLDTLRAAEEDDEAEEEEEEAIDEGPSSEDQRKEAERDEKIRQAEERAATHEKKLLEAIGKADLPPGLLEQEPPPPNLEELAASMEAAGSTPAEVHAVMEALSDHEDEEPPDEPKPPPLRERVVTMLHAQASFSGFDFEEGDLSDLDFSGRELVGALLQNANFQRASFAGADLTEAQLGDGDFTEACFDGANLTNADLTASTLVRASFEFADLTAAELSDAIGPEADFAGATGEGIFFTGGDWKRGIFDGVNMTAANFSGAALAGASFRKAKLAKINLRDAYGGDVSFEQAEMHAIRGDGCKLHRCSLHRVEAPKSVFENAELLDADLSDANLSGSSFLRASCLRANFARSELVESNLAFAKLTGTNFQRANLMMSVLDDADLTIADLRSSNLYGCAFIDANLQDAKLDGAITAKSSLVMKPPPSQS
jgi:uncharacterized protein YjbI with pentapeptide repeats